MRSLFMLLLLLVSFPILAGTLNYQQFQKLNSNQQFEILSAYKEFLSQQNDLELAEKVSKLNITLFTEAYAAGNFNCFYAGWPSQKKQVSANGKTKFQCSNPANTNSSYKSAASQCSGSQLLCNPTIFGKGHCVSVATQSLRNQAFAQCEKKFESTGGDLKKLAGELASGQGAAEADEMFQLVNDVCNGGFQSSSSMCRNLKEKISYIIKYIKEKPEAGQSEQAKPAEQAEPAKQVARPQEDKIQVVDQGKPISNQDAREEVIIAVNNVEVLNEAVQHTHGPGCGHDHLEPRVPQTQVTAANNAPDSLKPVQCGKPIASSQTRTRAELDQILKDNNVVYATPVTNEEYLWDFVGQMERFPLNIRQDMAKRGIEIRIMVGDGVTVDPTWNGGSIAKNAPGASTSEVRLWSQVPGAGGPSTRVAVNHLYDKHGSTNIFLHEHAHTFDLNSKPAKHKSPEFKALRGTEPKYAAFLKELCPLDYCATDEVEGFAELFAYYNSCSASREHMQKHMPAVAQYFSSLSSGSSISGGPEQRLPAGQAQPKKKINLKKIKKFFGI